MSTARALALIALGLPAERAVEPGDLSLVLAGAEAADLLADGRLSLDGDGMMPGDGTASDERLLDEAFASLVRHPPRESSTGCGAAARGLGRPMWTTCVEPASSSARKGTDPG
ncbi:hypothetical protein [Streptomyces sp. NPDC059805]|uniref:hypothetical protein n=1 Tax=Streptomyces sp. NPDC059805 TaxID=3346954 RepID=UPI0036659ADE